jgi:hypothetical protein
LVAAEFDSTYTVTDATVPDVDAVALNASAVPAEF